MAARPSSAVPHRPSTAGAAPGVRASQSQLATGTDAVTELKDLARALRHKEAEYKTWQENMQKELRRQELEREALRRENEPLQAEANALRATEATSSHSGGGITVGALRPSSALASGRNGGGGRAESAALRRSKSIDAKREQLLHLKQLNANQREKNEELERAIDETRHGIHEARQRMGGVNVVSDSHNAVGQQIKILENRLDQSLQRFNQVLGENKALRDEIDTLRAERDVFDLIYLKLEAELQEKKKEMAFIIEVSNIAYEERDNNVQVLQNLKQFAQEEMNSFQETFKELDLLVEEDRKMREQVRQRLVVLEKKERVFDEDGAGGHDGGSGGRSGKKGDHHGHGHKGDKSLRDGTSPRGGADGSGSAGQSHRGGGGGNSSSNGGAEESDAQRLRNYEEVFESLRTSTNSADLERVVHKFLHAEEDNFSLFSYVNDLGREVEQLEKQRAQLLHEMDGVTGGSDADRERRQTLQQLEDKLRAEEIAKDRLTEHIHRTEGILRSVMLSIEQIFTKLDGDDSVVIQEHGVAGITFESLLLYLAAVESRADELLNAWSKNSGIPVDPSHGALLRGPQAAFDAVQQIVDSKRLPTTGEEETNMAEDDSRPLTREELLRRAQKKVALYQAAVERKAAQEKKRTTKAGR